MFATRFIDLDTFYLVGSAAADAPLPSIGRIKRGSNFSLPIQFIQGGVVKELSVGASGTLGFKPLGQYGNATYAAAPASWVKTGTGAAALYTFNVTFINSAMNALFSIGGDPTLDPGEVILGGEIKWIDNTGTHETKPDFILEVLNDINRGGETIPITPLGTAPFYIPSITQLLGNVVVAGIPISLDALPTKGFFSVGNLIFVRITGAGIEAWVLTSGIANPADPGQVPPADYDVVLNQVYWQIGS